MSDSETGPGPGPGLTRRAKIIRFAVAGAILAAFLAVALYLSQDNAVNAEVGDCLEQTGANSVEVVACDDSAARFKVVGRVADKTEIEASIRACIGLDGVEQTYWQGESGEKGFVLCLAPIDP